MRRRALIASLAAGYLLGTRFALAAPGATARRLGIFVAGWCDSKEGAEWFAPLLKALADLGYAEGRNLTLVRRCFEMDFARAAPMAAELARLKLDAILTTGTPQTKALQEATRTIPIVTSLGDPVASGLVKSLSKPGGNITGLCHTHPDFNAKQIELLQRVVPRLDRMMHIGDSRYTGMRQLMTSLDAAARAAGIAVEVRMVDRSGYEAVFREAKALGIKAAVIDSPDIDIPEVARLAILNGVATMLNGAPEFAEQGGLMDYNPFHENPMRRTAIILDKIFRGMKPADIPWELPDRTSLVINLRTAKALGLTFPQDVLLRADKVIE